MLLILGYLSKKLKKNEMLLRSYLKSLKKKYPFYYNCFSIKNLLVNELFLVLFSFNEVVVNLLKVFLLID